jgi:hypothetical protein
MKFPDFQCKHARDAIVELVPRQGRLFDKLAVLGAVTSVDEHSDSIVHTGYTRDVSRSARHPSCGLGRVKLFLFSRVCQRNHENYGEKQPPQGDV